MKLQDYNNTGDTTAGFTYATNWDAQTFKASTKYKIAVVKLKIFRTGTVANATLSLRATSGGLPTGVDLVSKVLDVSSLPTGTGGTWVEFEFAIPYQLTKNVTYALVFRSTGTSGSNCIRWRQSSVSTYPDGQFCDSSNAGASWTGFSIADQQFETYSGGGFNATKLLTLN